MRKKYILALDQGTTSSRAILFDVSGRAVAMAQRECHSTSPHPGWVEQDPLAIWGSQLGAARDVLEKLGASPDEVAAIGISSQRETTLVWDRVTGRPVCNAIARQCWRTSGLCDELKARGLGPYVRENTGLVLDGCFSGPKLKWILDHVPGARERAQRGELLFGNVDAWLIWNLTQGKVHCTDYSNASRTMLFNLKDLAWDPRILAEMDIPLAMLPEVKPSSGVLGLTDPRAFPGAEIAIAGDAGDQQAALFGIACFSPGMAKNTYAAGCFMLMNTGARPVPSSRGLLTTIAWATDNRVEYALEGGIFVGGAALQWLRDETGPPGDSGRPEPLAAAGPASASRYGLPAFVGLGSPYWDMNARGAIFGLARGAGRNPVARATVEAIAYQTRDVLRAMEKDSGIRLKGLKADGGAAANNFLLQLQADVLGVPVERPLTTETQALGAAFLAGLAVGFWRNKAELAVRWEVDRTFKPVLEPVIRDRKYAGWLRAVSRARSWEVPG